MEPLEEHVVAVYRRLVHEPAAPPQAIAAELGLAEEDVTAAISRLIDADLVRVGSEDDGELRPVNPERALGGLVVAAEEGVVRATQQLNRLRNQVGALTDEYRVARDRTTSTRLERLDGPEAVVSRVAELVTEVQREVCGFVTRRPSRTALEEAREADETLLGRGVRVRNICLDSVRSDRRFMAHLGMFRELGAEIRTTPTLPTRMIVFDDRVAVIAQDPDEPRLGAVVLHGKGLMAAATGLFESYWELGSDPFGSAVPAAPELVPNERALLKLLSQGQKDLACARQLDVSVRTVRRMVADIAERAGASSRFELAIMAAQRDWV